jgi:4'-phosphopantetheinyl transferase
VELVEPRSLAFVADYFTAKEQVRVARESTKNRDRLVTLLWSAKESTLKALRAGLRLDTRSVIVNPFPASYDFNGWSRLLVRYSGEPSAESRVFHGWWQLADNIVRTVVAAPPPDSPIPLTIPAHVFEGASCCA